MQPLSGNQRPDLLTSLIKMSLVLRLPRAMVFADPLQMSHACYRFEHVTKPSRLITCDKVQNPLRLPHKTMLQRPKVARTCGVLTFWFWHVLHATTPCTFQHLVNLVVRDSQFLTLWTLKCASLQDGVHFFNISTSKSGPRQFLTLWTLKCPSRHKGVHFFNISTFKSGPGQSVFNTLDSGLWNVLHATRVCTFSTSQLPKVVRDSQFLTFWTLKYASRHNGVHFFNISTSKSGPRQSVFNFNTFDFEMCFVPLRRDLFGHLNFQKWSETVRF